MKTLDEIALEVAKEVITEHGLVIVSMLEQHDYDAHNLIALLQLFHRRLTARLAQEEPPDIHVMFEEAANEGEHMDDAACWERVAQKLARRNAAPVLAPGMVQVPEELLEAVNWILNDAAYKAPEQIGSVAIRWCERLAAAKEKS